MKIKVISLWQPWAEAMRVLAKENETRSWWTRHRGWLGIHAAKKPIDKSDQCFVDFAEHWVGDLSKLDFGALIAIAWMADCIRTEKAIEMIDECEELWGNYDEGRYAWVTDGSKLIVLPKPLALRGAQGLFDWEVPEEICQQFPQLVNTQQYRIGAYAPSSGPAESGQGPRVLTDGQEKV